MTVETNAEIGPTPRPLVDAFARIMETQLRANDHKGGWSHLPPKWLLARACQEFSELVESIRPNDPNAAIAKRVENALFLARYHLILAARCLNDVGPHDKLEIGETHLEAADVANFLMMFLDLTGGLEKEAGVGAADQPGGSEPCPTPPNPLQSP